MFDDSDKRDFFRRQRRNLIAASIVTAFYEAAELKFTTINLLGNKVEVGNPEIVSAAIATAFIYFLWRYYTACREVGGLSQFSMASISWAEERARAYVTRNYLNSQKHKYERVDSIKREGLQLTFRLQPRTQTDAEEYVIVRKRYWFYRMISYLMTTLQTSTFTEYVLPYIFALIAGLELSGIDVIEPLISTMMRV